MSKRDFGGMLKADLRRVTGDHRIARRDIKAVGLKEPKKLKEGLTYARLTLGPVPLYVVYRPKPERFVDLVRRTIADSREILDGLA